MMRATSDPTVPALGPVMSSGGSHTAGIAHTAKPCEHLAVNCTTATLVAIKPTDQACQGLLAMEALRRRSSPPMLVTASTV